MTTIQHRSDPITDELLADVLDAHGGLENWNDVTEITAELSLGGPFWGARGWPDVYADQTVTLDLHREHITFAPFTAPDRISAVNVDPRAPPRAAVSRCRSTTTRRRGTRSSSRTSRARRCGTT
jgi:hypothetical protein